MKLIQMFPDRLLVENPRVLYRRELPPADFKFEVEVAFGEFYLVVPRVAKEVYFIQMLGKNIDVFLPAEGEGLLIKKRAIDSL